MKLKVLILDVYPDVNYRISKDLNGGYGTGNDYGDSWFSKLLKLFVKNSINFHPLNAILYSLSRNRNRVCKKIIK